MGASRVAAGMLAPVTEIGYGEEPLLRLSLCACDRYPSFVDELEYVSGHDVGYRACGMLAVAFDPGDRAVLDDLRVFQQSLGLGVEPLSGRECRRIEPFLSPSVQAGQLVRGDHQVDPRRLSKALLVAVVRSGVALRPNVVSRLLVRSGGITGVELDDGSVLAAGTVVLAAGCRSGEIDGIPQQLRPPVRPVKGQVIRLRATTPGGPPLSRSVRGMVHGAPVYLVPREDGELVVGATQEERGFDEQVTAGGVYELLRDAHTIVPGITELSFAEASAGLRPCTPDNAPIIGPLPLEGLVVATGHHRNGVLLAPITADAVATLLADGRLPEFAEPFSPHRFISREMHA
jgi:glycine oxidase